ncbi:MAG: hypothetical protein LJE84_02705 [Gammaproteobacteria bacterium]|nr:hypothetical protein [Gammaproteobacteria bacterium]
MEFFRFIDRNLPQAALESTLTVGALPALSASFETLLEDHGERGRLWSVWGEFEIQREIIRRGIRFTMPACPNAFAWTVTREPLPGETHRLVFHATINRTEHDPDFIDSLEQFADQWQASLEDLAQAGLPKRDSA